MKGYVVPDQKLRQNKGYQRLESLYTGNPVVHSSVNNVTMSLFDVSRRDDFEIECTNQTLMPLFSELISQPIPGVYGNEYFHLSDFFSDIYRSLIVFGKVFVFVDYAKEPNEQFWKIQGLRFLPIETIKVNSHRGKIKSFSQQYSKDFAAKNNLKKIDFLPDEIFFVEWIFDKNSSPGCSPLMRLIPNVERNIEFLNFMSLQVYAMTHPEDHSYKVERARYDSFEKKKKLNEISDLTIRATIGTWSDAPMTEYYATYNFAKCRQRVALVREYLVDQFNIQVIKQMSKKNRLNEPAKISLNGYLSSQEISKLIEQYEKQEIAQDVFLKMLLNDMHETHA